jgi:MYXO-CTERM domain-containing protein
MRHRLTSVLALSCVVGIGASSACQTDTLTTGREQAPVIYGADNRQDVYDYSDQTWAGRVAEFTAALVAADSVNDANPDDVQLAGATLQAAYGVCSDERFASQITPAFCSGTLIADDLVLTAGQCIRDQNECDATRVVFNFYMSAPDTLATITSADVYGCAAIVAHRFTGNLDHAVIRLDRPVTGRTRAPVRVASTALDEGTPLSVHGTPSGLPIKIDAGGSVRHGREIPLDYFVANLDTFADSAGSGVFNRETGELVGVLARGESDYVLDETCMRPNVCPDSGCAGEDVTYAFRAIADLCGDGTCQEFFGEATTNCVSDCGSACGDGVCNGPESPTSCPEDCGTCGNGVCDPGETAVTCSMDGCPPLCGDGVCNGQENSDPFSYLENPNSCLVDCSCGNGTCDAAYGETITSCRADCASKCGDGMCEAIFGETTATCVQDCGSECRDGVCNGDEDSSTCEEDCPWCGNGTCDDGQEGRPDQGEDPNNCCADCGCAEPGLSGCQGNVCVARGDTCDDPAIMADPVNTHVSLEGSVTIAGDTWTAGPGYAGTCITGASPERVYQFTLKGYRTAIDIQVSGGYDTALYLRRTCDDASAESELACNEDSALPADGDAAETIGSRIEAELPRGTYYLFVDGYNGDSGEYTLWMDQRLICQNPDADRDGDGICDEYDSCPDDPNHVDSDGDGVPDCDRCPDDPAKTEPGTCGCGVPEGECDTGCSCEVGRAPSGKNAAGGLMLAMVAFIALRRPRRRRCS